MTTDIKLFDHYSWRARVQPALLALLPIGFAVVACTPASARWPATLWGLLTTAGFTYFVKSVARDRGARAEPELWASWGGAPTTQLLRHSGSANPVSRASWHRSMAKLLGPPFPSEQEEIADPSRADAVYEEATRLLRDRTRNKKTYPLVYDELVAYGFCRNLYGMKAVGVWVASLAVAATGVVGLASLKSQFDVLPWAVCGLCLLSLTAWLKFVNAQLVKTHAFKYAHRLLEGSEKAAKGKSAPKVA